MSQIFFQAGDFPLVPLGDGSYSRRLLAAGGGLMLGEMEFEAGSTSAVHAHEEEQLTYCVSGEFEASVGGQTKTLKPGDSFVAGRGVPHGARCLVAGRLLHAFTPQRDEYFKGAPAAK